MAHLLEGALDADACHHIGGLTDTGCIDETEGDATKVDGVFYHISGGTVDVAHDGLFFVQKGVEKGRLTGIRFTDNGHGDSVLDGIPYVE